MINRILFILLAVSFFSCEKNQYEKGNEFFAANDYENAISSYSSYLSTHPKHIKSLYNRGRAYEETDKLELAVEDYKMASDIEPRDMTFVFSLGIVHFKLEQYSQVVLDMNRVLKIHPNNADAHSLKGRAQIKQGLVKDALKSYDLALTHDKNHEKTYLYRGMLKILTKQSGGCADLKKALSLGEENAQEYIDKHCK
ncbi:tetratricopeptide repeat protein [Flammeovirgaceae bacterium SG7u.111]|nr:tetratricopeptide repeat protein [Flammeovirgaceae bacterium SG7u.132]WPO36937.1 tetratricopeptide repeat protein [Flammeovirgaceae bacterium SG7u.111]